MTKITISFYVLVSLVFLIYLSIPSSDFPKSIPESLQSSEPADVETPFRRGYFTNLGREDVVLYYKNEMSKDYFGFRFPTIRLNYSPEEAGTIIRDQTKSSYLEEIVIPFRESLYVNGFIPKENKDAIIVNGQVYSQKVTVKLIDSAVFARIITGLLVVLIVPVLFLSWKNIITLTLTAYKNKKT